MNKTFNLLFYVKKAKINSVGESPIYLRITIDGKISEISTKRTVKPSKWNSAMQKVSGSSEECRSLNFYLKNLYWRYAKLSGWNIKSSRSSEYTILRWGGKLFFTLLQSLGLYKHKNLFLSRRNVHSINPNF